jgi:hypothetical protein
MRPLWVPDGAMKTSQWIEDAARSRPCSQFVTKPDVDRRLSALAKAVVQRGFLVESRKTVGDWLGERNG